ncbi:hypothetical protein D3C74_414890 [compost metagenome]
MTSLEIGIWFNIRHPPSLHTHPKQPALLHRQVIRVDDAIEQLPALRAHEVRFCVGS